TLKGRDSQLGNGVDSVVAHFRTVTQKDGTDVVSILAASSSAFDFALIRHTNTTSRDLSPLMSAECVLDESQDNGENTGVDPKTRRVGDVERHLYENMTYLRPCLISPMGSGKLGDGHVLMKVNEEHEGSLTNGTGGTIPSSESLALAQLANQLTVICRL
ncbi:hypothetical protein BaRGS_00040101, partial [Batillaria attramentaria]